MISTEATSAAASFLQQQPNSLSPESLYRSYAHYLLRTSAAWELPVPLDRIRKRYQLKRQAVSLKQRGFLLGDAIFVNNDDPASVQRFTEAHEMMETLTAALRSEGLSHLPKDARPTFDQDKERWCEAGAAELLLPADLFFPLVEEYRTSLNTARYLAGYCHTSLTATLRKMLEADQEACIFAILRAGHKKSQFVPSQVGQTVLWGDPKEWDPPQELRVWRRWNSPQVKDYLCFNESFSRDNLAYAVLKNEAAGVIRSDYDGLDLEYIQGTYYVEAVWVSFDETPLVMTLIHLS